MQQEKRPCLVSACLVGLCTRYDARVQSYIQCLEKLRDHCWIPVCPEQLGGLSTPRIAADLVGGNGNAVLDGVARVVTRDGRNVTRNFVLGAEQCLHIALAQGVRSAFLRAKSPSCGLTRLGVTAALLIRHDIEIIEF